MSGHTAASGARCVQQVVTCLPNAYGPSVPTGSPSAAMGKRGADEAFADATASMTGGSEGDWDRYALRLALSICVTLPQRYAWTIRLTVSKSPPDRCVVSGKSKKKKPPGRSSQTPTSAAASSMAGSQDKSSKGLRHFSMRVCKKVEEKGRTNYNEVGEGPTGRTVTR